MRILKKILKLLTSKFSKIQLLVIVVVIFFGFFVSDSSIFSRISHGAKIRELESEIKYYREQSIKDSKKLEELKDDKEHIEQFARENYYMKKPDEDVFIVE